MKASEVMTTPVVTVQPDTSVAEIARLLHDRRISAVPVMEGERLVGIVSEGDLLRRKELGTERRSRRGAWWLLLLGEDRSPQEYVKAHGQRAADIMTREVVSVAPDTPLAEVAMLLESRAIKRVPVVDRGRLVGIVSRANLVQALAAQKRPEPPPANGDDAIRAALIAELEREPWWQRVGSNVIVTDGTVHYWGTVDSEDDRRAARVAAENVPGVRRVEDHRVQMDRLPSGL